MFEILGTIFSSIFAGGATGLIGVAVQRYFDHKNKKLDMQVEQMRITGELDKRRLDIENTRAEWEGRGKVAMAEADAAKDVAESNAFAESLKAAASRVFDADMLKDVHPYVRNFVVALLGLIEVVKEAVRPGLTVYLCVLTTFIYYEARQILDTAVLTAEQAFELVRLIVSTVLYLTTTCVLWHFGTRNKQKPPKAAF